jgi:signal transduction histidine kinase
MIETPKRLIDWKIAGAIIWLIFTLALSIWWTRLGLQYIGPKRQMILGEGITLIVCLAIGGVALIYYILQERKRYREVHHFFACANHELKTYMASIRLRAEGLELDLEKTQYASDAHKIVRDTNRLELQLENSLMFSTPGQRQLFRESINLKEFILTRADHYKDLQVIVNGEITLDTDQRMLDVIIRNIIQNTQTHAEAKQLEITIEKQCVTFVNDGKAFQGELKKLGVMFYRHAHQSRSGIGLFLVVSLMKSLGGHVHFSLNEKDQLRTKLVFDLIGQAS